MLGWRSIALEKFVAILALDLHRQTSTAVRLEADGRLSLEETRPTQRANLQDWLRQQAPGTRVVVEPTGPAYVVLEMAQQLGLVPRLASSWALGPLAMRRRKDDQQDALRLAQLERGQVLHTVWIPDAETRELRSLVAHREHLVELRTSLKSRLHALFARHLIELPAQPFDSEVGLVALRQARAALPAVDQLATDQDLMLARVLAQQILQVEEELARRLQARWETPLLLSIPGLSLVSASALLAALGPIERFQNAKQVASYLGLAPRRCETGGKRVGSPQDAITGWGHRQARRQLFHVALKSIQAPGPLRAFYQDLRERQKERKVGLVAVARKLVTLLWHILHRRQPCRWSPPLKTHEKLRQVALRAGQPRLALGPPKGTPRSSGGAPERRRQARHDDLEPARQAEAAYRLQRAQRSVAGAHSAT